jgi:hypothetical protein
LLTDIKNLILNEINDAIKLDKYINDINEKANLIACFLSKIILLEIKITTTNGTMKIAGGNISASSEFTVVLEDFKIAIPGVVKDKLSKIAKIKINCTLSIAK